MQDIENYTTQSLSFCNHSLLKNVYFYRISNSEKYSYFILDYFMSNTTSHTDFFKKLLAWYNQNHRPMPWKHIRDPYLIWISEIILQQTRVNQGWDYYENFKKKFPDIQTLANSGLDEVMKAWEGLGYYSRARNLHKTAQILFTENNGEFPKTYNEMLKLPGIGAYTAAAISSFAYDLPNAVVDGNVVRVLSRYFGIAPEGNEKLLKTEIQKLADSLVLLGKSSDYNQAIMDFGATQCTPAKPACTNCSLNQNCFAFQKNQVGQLPPKLKKPVKKDRFFLYYLIYWNDGIYIQKRKGDDIWKNLYELPFQENTEDQTITNLPNYLLEADALLLEKPASVYKHILTHQNIFARLCIFKLHKPLETKLTELQYVETKNLCNFAFPKLIINILKQQGL